jgi:hypothetical protein
MGIGSNWAVEVQEEKEKKAWIRKELNNPDADESTEGWEELETAYEQRDFDDFSDNYDDYLAEIAFEDYLDEVEYANFLKSISSSYSKVFDEKIASIKKIMDLSIDEKTDKDLLIMLYGHTISAIEGYIYTTFFNTVMQSDGLLRKLVETDPSLKDKTIKLTDFFIENQPADAVVKSTITEYLKEIIYHKIKKIKPMYKSVLDIDFGDVGWLFKAVKIRHDCVHRAGYTQDGIEIKVEKDQLKELIKNCEDFVLKLGEDLAMEIKLNPDLF